MKWLSPSVGVLMLSACQSAGQAVPSPAVIVDANAAVRAELQQVVSNVLNRTNVLLADNALTSSSELIIETARPRDGAGRLLNGRELGNPEHFSLLRDGTRCFLVHERTQRRYELKEARCVLARSKA
jgi:hypothetical protein